MRDSVKHCDNFIANENRSIVSRKRRWLAAVLIMSAASPATLAMAENHRPLLPLPTAVDQLEDVKVNPFCLPENEGYDKASTLASSGQQPAVRLKKIGAAIGLHSIEDDQAIRQSTPQMLIEEAADGEVRTNPMANHQPAKANPESQELSESDSSPADQPQSPKRRSSKLVLMPLAPSPTQHEANPHQTINYDKVITSDASAVVLDSGAPIGNDGFFPVGQSQQERQQPLTDVDSIQPLQDSAIATPDRPTENPVERAAEPSLADQMRSQPLVDPVEPPAPEPSEPVSFSFSDQEPAAESPEVASTDSPSVVAPSPEQTIAPEPAADPTPSANEKQAAVVSAPPQAPAAPEPAPIELNDAEAMADAMPMDAMPATRENRFCQAADGLHDSAASQQDQLQSKRYRPPVAVHPVPVAIEGVVNAPTFLVEAAADTEIKVHVSPKERALKAAKVVPLYLERAQVRSLTLGAELRSVEVANKDVCQAFAAGPNQIKLIGTHTGVTRLVVWAEPSDAQSPPRVRAFDVHVKESASQGGQSTQHKIKLLNESIRDAFPNANVVVHERNGKIFVNGNCSNDVAARKIVRMVRKTCLVAVEDQLQVR